jgi:hypothetical protein
MTPEEYKDWLQRKIHHYDIKIAVNPNDKCKQCRYSIKSTMMMDSFTMFTEVEKYINELEDHIKDLNDEIEGLHTFKRKDVRKFVAGCMEGNEIIDRDGVLLLEEKGGINH